MATARVDEIVRWVMMKLKSEKAGRFDTVDPGLVIYELNDIQEELAKECLARERTAKLVLQTDIDKYDVGSPIYKIVAIKEPDSWLNDKIEIVQDPEVWNERRRLDFQIQRPRWARVWQGQIEFWPVPGTDYDESEIELTLYMLPEKTLDFGKDPDLDPMYDKALRYGTLAAFVPEFTPMYESEKKRLQHERMSPTLQPLLVNHSSRDLGF